MCRISNDTLSITIQLNLQAPQAIHCSLYKRGSHPTEIHSTATIPCNGGTVRVQLQIPDANSHNWDFCVLGFSQGNNLPVCQKVTSMTSLIATPMVTF